MEKKWLDYLRVLIANDQLDEVFEVLLSRVEDLPHPEEVVLLSARLARIKKNDRQQTLDPEHLSRERNQLIKATLELLSTFEQTFTTSSPGDVEKLSNQHINQVHFGKGNNHVGNIYTSKSKKEK